MPLPRKPLQPAKPSFTARLLALLLDYGLILAYMGLLAATAGVLYLATGSLPDWLAHGVAVAEIAGFFALVLPVGLYLYFSETSSYHATIGKRVLKLIVVSDQGLNRASRPQIAIRTAVKLLPWEWAHFFVWHTVAVAADHRLAFPVWLKAGLASSIALPVIYVLFVALEPKGRGLHDLLARTRVITRKD